ncbi:PALP domain-containing protein [Bordetella pertussis]|uniref:hypothetical protein n=1 Tax=Bordetella pertussis TaxID=520 RepID=UPI00374FD154
MRAQVVYYFHGWLRAAPKGGEVSSRCLRATSATSCPGTSRAAWACRSAAWCWPQREQRLEEFFRTGGYRPRGPEHTYATSSPSMDISRASNFERFVFDLVGRDPGRVASLWADLARDGSFDLSALKPQFETRYGFVAGASSHADRLQTYTQYLRRKPACWSTAHGRWHQGGAPVRRAGRAHAGARDGPAGQVRGTIEAAARAHRAAAG